MNRHIVLLLCLLFQHSKSIRNITLSGNSTIGYYFIDAYIGTPPQKQSLILDTGSNLTILPCKGCKECRSHINPMFDGSKSSTFKKLKTGDIFVGWKCPFFSTAGECGFSQGYTEGSMYKGTK